MTAVHDTFRDAIWRMVYSEVSNDPEYLIQDVERLALRCETACLKLIRAIIEQYEDAVDDEDAAA